MYSQKSGKKLPYKTPRILITLNAFTYNRGSEALVRGLVIALRSAFPSSYITVCSGNKGQQQCKIEKADKICPRFSRGHIYSPAFWLGTVKEIVFKKQCHFFYRELIKEASQADCILVVGADNYDSTYHIQTKMEQINDILFKNSDARMLLIDCSFAAKDINRKVIKDIDRFDQVTVRENLSYATLSKHLSNKKISVIPDPAFLMPSQQIENILENGCEGNVGINVSDLILKSVYFEKITENYHNLIQFILSETNMRIILLPHVMNCHDLSALKKIYSAYEKCDRVQIVKNEDYNAAQLKYIIGKLDFLITARTHASIAAYSQYVPTLVVGYSVKSFGIAEDIFGESEHFVVKLNQLKTDHYLTDKFRWIYQHGNAISEHLKKVMPEYFRNALQYGRLIQDTM